MTFSLIGISDAQTTPIPGNPDICRELQSQVNDIVSVSRSNVLSDDEKIKKLMESWGRSLASMQASSKGDPEIANIVKGFIDSITKVLSKADVSGNRGDRDVSGDTKQDLDMLRERVRPYIQIMKLQCPDLRLPEVSKK